MSTAAGYSACMRFTFEERLKFIWLCFCHWVHCVAMSSAGTGDFVLKWHVSCKKERHRVRI